MKQKLYALTATLLLSLFVGTGLWAQTSETCGDNISWELSADGVLTITGSGKMHDWGGSSRSPWYNNQSIKEVVVGEGITRIGDNAFDLCKNLTKATLPSGLTEIGAEAFNYCDFSNGIALPESLEKIESYAFSTCSLKKITIPEKVKFIGAYAFSNNFLTSITIPASVTEICSNICYGSNPIENIVVAKGNKVYTSRTSVDSSEECNAIINIADKTLQEGCKNTLIPTNAGLVTTIGAGAFMTCHGLKSITIPDNITAIDDVAFDRCDYMTAITIGKGVTTIGREAFWGCERLKKITINATTPPTCGYGCFNGVPTGDGCEFSSPEGTTEAYKRAWANVLSDHTTFSKVARLYAEYNRATKAVKVYYGTPGTVADDVTLIDSLSWKSGEYNMLSDVQNYIYYELGKKEMEWEIDSVDFDKSVKDYEFSSCGHLFSGLSGLKSITNLQYLSTGKVTDFNNMFYSCAYLESLDLSGLNTSSATNAIGMFKWCNNLKSINLSSINTSKMEVMSTMFEECQSLESLDLSSFDTQNATTMSDMFAGCMNLKNIYVSDNFKTDKVTDSEDMFADGTDKANANYTTGKFLKKVGSLGGQPLGAKGKDLTIANLDLSADADYVLTETSPVTATKATYSRSMSSKWGTLCLPYDIDAADNSAVKFYTVATIGDDNVITLSQLTGTIKAGTPVLFYNNTNENKVTFASENVALAKTANTQNQLVGTYTTKEVPSTAYFIAKDAFHLASAYSTGGYQGVKTKGFRAYLQSSTPKASLLRIAAGGTTGIDGTVIDDLNSSAAEYYNIDGTRTNGLHRGLNIVKVGGKTRKVMVK